MLALLALLAAPADTGLVTADSGTPAPALAPMVAPALSLAPSYDNLSSFHVSAEPLVPLAAAPAWVEEDTVTRRRRAVEHSSGYYTRRDIHKIASYATLPLFAAEYYVGQRLYTGHENLRGAHSALAAGLAGLFAVNTLTGLWNLLEDKEPEGRTRRWIHGLAMLAADAGFVATAGTAPESEHGEHEGNRSLHRGLAITSGSVALGSYLMMLLWKD